MCIFDNCVLLVTVQFEILFFIKFYKNAEFCFTFFFLSYVVSTQNTSLLFFGEGHILLIERLQSWIDMGKNTFSPLVLRDFLLVPGRRDPLMLIHISHLGTNTLWSGKTQICFYVLFSLHLKHRLDSLKSRDLLGSDPEKLVTSMSGNPDLIVSPLRWHPSKEQQFHF